MSDILEGPKDSWLQCYTSNRVGEQEVDHIISALKNKGLVALHANGTTLSWRDFPDKPSVLHEQRTAQNTSARARTGREIFRPLGDIISSISEVPLSGLSPSCTYAEEPYCTQSNALGSTHHVDGHLRLIEATSSDASGRLSRAATSDIVVNFEFKWNDEPGNIIYNRWKALYSVSHTLHSDCRRKHTYSITIEDTRVCLWYFSRSHVAKSQEFDLLDVRAVVGAFASLVFSTPEDLGYDANISRILEHDEHTQDDETRYVYRLEDRFFKTIKSRDEYYYLNIVGRATRVWEVIEVASFDDTAALPDVRPMVLRDVWLEHGGRTEREIQEEILQRCDDLGRNFPADDDDRLRNVDEATRQLLRQRLADGTYKELFLTIEEDYSGASSNPCAVGYTPAPHIFAERIYIDHGAERDDSDSTQQSSVSDSCIRLFSDISADGVPQSRRPHEYNPKRRNFVVYREVCSAMHELDDLHDAVGALLDALLALQILFLISWIHRDVSSGNILFYEGRGKLCDLEYAKEFDLAVARRSSDPKTGTKIFMAVEVESGTTIYKKRWPKIGTAFMQPMAPLDPHLVVRHNFQHDVESIFWILAWLVCTHIPGQSGQKTMALMFHSNDPEFYRHRLQFLIDRGFCAQQLDTLRPPLPPVLRANLLAMSSLLYDGYLERADSIDDRSSYSPIYGEVREALTVIVNAIPPGTVALARPTQRIVGPRSGYRPRTDDLAEKLEEAHPEDVVMAPREIATTTKRARGLSDADDESRLQKRLAQE